MKFEPVMIRICNPTVSAMLFTAGAIAIPYVAYSAYHGFVFIIAMGYIGLLIYDYLMDCFRFKKIFVLVNFSVLVLSCYVTYVSDLDTQDAAKIIVLMIAVLAGIVNDRIFAKTTTDVAASE